MTRTPRHVADFLPALQQAIRLARQAGLAASATELEKRAFAAATTSSERVGEVGEAVLQFRARERGRVPADVSALLDDCLREVGKVWPKYRPRRLRAWAARVVRWWTR